MRLLGKCGRKNKRLIEIFPFISRNMMNDYNYLLLIILTKKQTRLNLAINLCKQTKLLLYFIFGEIDGNTYLCAKTCNILNIEFGNSFCREYINELGKRWDSGL